MICEEYFVPVLSQLGDRWKMAEDVLGVIFKVQDKTCNASQRQRLVFVGKMLKDALVLSTYNIQKESALHMSVSHSVRIQPLENGNSWKEQLAVGHHDSLTANDSATYLSPSFPHPQPAQIRN